MIRWTLLALAVATAFFAAFPGTDIAVSGLFFDGNNFPVQDNRILEAIRLTLYAAEELAAAATLLLVAVTAWQRRAILRLGARDWTYAFAVFALGPGLLVNGILKRFWGRARPYSLTEFGGQAQFSPPWVISDQCAANCSFVSGEMSGAVAVALLLAMILTANRGHRWGWLVVVAIPLFTAWQRIAAGRHFLSDVVISALLTVLIAAILMRVLTPAKAT